MPDIYGRRLMEYDLGDDAGGNRDENVIGACLNPVITSRRSAQVMAAPIANYVLPAAIFVRKALAFVQVMPWAGPPPVISPVIVCASMVVAAIGLKAMTAIVAWAATLGMFVAIVIVLTIIALSERRTARRQTYCHDGRNNGFIIHTSSL
jgi:hypothetical protein